MAGKEFEYTRLWQLEATPEQLWPLVADTNRFNKDAQTPSIRRREDEAPMGRRALRLVIIGMVIDWDEEPFEWVRPQRFSVTRCYKTGPIGQLTATLEMTREGDFTALRYTIRAQASGLLGLVVIPNQIGRLINHHADHIFRAYDAQVRQAATAAPPGRDRVDRVGAARLDTVRAKLIADGIDGLLFDRVAALARTGDDMTLARMRPYALADDWGVDRRALLTVFLHATREGALDFHWELICPLCRGASEVLPTLAEVKSAARCSSCEHDYEVEFSRGIELCFRPNATVRQVKTIEFCVGGPQLTPHIALQLVLGPGDVRDLDISLAPGDYRLRTLRFPAGRPITVAAGGAKTAALRANDHDCAPLTLAPESRLAIENSGDQEEILILEENRWQDQSVTAADVTTMQAFRDLFAEEALRHGERLSFGSLVIVFTDLRGSTQLYREIGDASAFGRVLTHFDVLRDAIVARDGVLVKTIGDAVMAAFHRPIDAVEAMLAAQASLVDANESLHLRAGVHYGPCIAVTLNGRLDYFGTTVNYAARLEGKSAGDDVVVSDVLFQDPEIRAAIEDERLTAERFDADLKGFAGERFPLWRLRTGSR